METFKCAVPSWNEVYNTAKKTADIIKSSDFYPDVVIGLSRGGLVPARLFCDFLHIKNCLSMKVDHWGITATKDGKARISHGLAADLTGKKVLVVDDITDTGQSMELARKYIEMLNPDVIKTATLIHLNGSKYIPDFYGVEREWAWIIFPWNYREDMVNIIKKIDEKGRKNINEIKESLKKDYDVEADLDELNEILEHIKFLEKVNNHK